MAFEPWDKHGDTGDWERGRREVLTAGTHRKLAQTKTWLAAPLRRGEREEEVNKISRSYLLMLCSPESPQRVLLSLSK